MLAAARTAGRVPRGGGGESRSRSSGARACRHRRPRANAAVGTFTTFDAPGAVFGTFPTGINPAAAITGFYFDANFGGHGFLRLSNGIITTFDVPGDFSTFPDSISPAGAIAGTYCDAIVCHGFLRASNGTITTFDVPGAV